MIKAEKKNNAGAERPLILCAYPKDSLYPELFYKALEKYDITALQGEIGLKWFLNNYNKLDLLHFHWPSFYYDKKRIISIARFCLFLTLAKLLGKKIVWTMHNLYPHYVMKVGKLDYLLRSFMILFSNLIFVHGQTAKKIVSAEFPFVQNKKFCIIQHGNYLDHYPNEISKSEARKKLGLSLSEFVYLSFGRANPYKGLDDLIDAYKLVTDDNDRLIIAGRFPNKDYLRRIKQKIQDSGTAREKIILFDRRIDDNEVQNFFNAASIMILPYKYKSVLTSGIALLSLSFGLPVIAPRLGYFNDLICDSKLGLLYENGSSIDKLAELMKKVKKMSFDRISIMEHIRKYSWDAIGCRANESLRDNLL